MKWTGVQSCYWPVRSGCGQGVGSSAPTLQAILLLVDCSRPFVHLFGTSVVVVPFFLFDFECGLCKKNHIRCIFFVFSTSVRHNRNAERTNIRRRLHTTRCRVQKSPKYLLAKNHFKTQQSPREITPGSMSLKITKSNASSYSVCPNTLPSTWLLLAFRRPFRNSPC